MGSSYISGFRTALRRWPLALVLVAATCLPGLAFAAAAWSWLAAALDKSLATRTLLTDLDMNVFVDLIAHHSESLRMLALGGVMLATVAWLVGVWLNAMTIVAVGEDAPLAAAAHRGLDLYATFLQLGVIAVAVDILVLIATVAVGRWLIQWTADNPSELRVFVIVGGGACIAGVLLLFLTAIHDHARIHSASTGSGAAAAYVWALGFVCIHERRALALAVVLAVSGGVGWLAYQTLGRAIVPTSTMGITLSLICGELLMVYRMFVRVWTFAAETELQNLSEAASG